MLYLKIILLFGLLGVFAGGCATRSVAQQSENSPNRKSEQANDSEISVQSGNLRPLSGEESAKIDEAAQREAEIPKEKLKDVPPPLKNLDFKNFSYPYTFSYGKKMDVRLKDGEHKFDFGNDRGWFELEEVYFADLTGDGEKEAIVNLHHVSCGYGSCDGGSDLFYVYAAAAARGQNKAALLWRFETGSLAYGCGLKAFTISGEKKIVLEVFGKCGEKMKVSDNENEISGKFTFSGYTRLVFGFEGGRFIKENEGFFSGSKFDARNYHAKISINQ